VSEGKGAPVILLPGAIMPAALAFAKLIEALGEAADVAPKELELYRDEEPPAGYSLETEIEGILRTAGEAGFDRFHLGGYSGGGAACLAFAARHPERLLSLALLEPAWCGNEGRSPEEEAMWAGYDRIMELPVAERMAEFARVQVRPGVEPPPPPQGEPPPWMARRPAGIVALTAAFRAHDLDVDRLRAFEQPVYYALGALSNPDQFERQADRLAKLFPDFTLDVYESRHHFDPPHRSEPNNLAASLRQLWSRARSA
jgi:pimeloyl-ACP methyl ester carboxylesterase